MKWFYTQRSDVRLRFRKRTGVWVSMPGRGTLWTHMRNSLSSLRALVCTFKWCSLNMRKQSISKRQEHVLPCVAPFSRRSGNAAASRGHHDGISLLCQSQAPLQQLSLPLHVILCLLCAHNNTQAFNKPLWRHDRRLHPWQLREQCVLPDLLTRLCRCWSRYSCLLVRADSHCPRKRSRSLSCPTNQALNRLWLQFSSKLI